MLINQRSGPGRKCHLCNAVQLEQCLAQLKFSERAKETIRQLFAFGDVNPIIESYIQKNCPFPDNQQLAHEQNLTAIPSLQAQKETLQQQMFADNLSSSSVNYTQPPATPALDQPTQRPPFAVMPPHQQQNTDEDAEISTSFSRTEPFVLKATDTKHQIRLPERGAFILGSWDSLGFPHPDINLVYDDRGQHSVSARHARISTKDKIHYIEDLESQHGTWLNDEQLQASIPVPLNPGDKVCLGRCILTVTEIPGYWHDARSVFTLYMTTNGREFTLPRHGELVIGRSDPPTGFVPDIDLGDGDPLALGISRRHAALRCWTHNIEITDLGSINGTEVDGIHIPPGIWVSIRPGQHFNLGEYGLALQVRKSKTTHL
jgi:pSer/pThr/pTyr-binding forkhead associated (FHA) protein